MESKSIAISTIPIPKLTALMNNFICNSITHLNKLSVKGDEKLAEFDKKLNDLEIMTTLLEAKLNSLPEKITSTYPELEPTTLDDLIPGVGDRDNKVEEEPPQPPPINPPDKDRHSSQDNNQNNQIEDKKVENNEQHQERIEEVKANLSPEDELNNFLEEHEDFKGLYKMLKFGIPTRGVKQKATENQLDMDLFDQLIVIAHKVNSSISLE